MGADTLHWYFLFPKGAHNDDSILGVAVDASTVAVFKDTISDSVNFLGRPSADEIREQSPFMKQVTTWIGEFIYQSPIDHEDPDHTGHRE